MYAKIFAQMYDGTLATNGPWEALVTFQQLLILADQDGIVDLPPAAITRRTTIPLEIIQRGLEVLVQPDPDSRTPDEGGRRILLLSDHRSWGWRIVNYTKYRLIKREQDRREYHRAYYHKRKKTQCLSTDSTSTQSIQPIAYAEANAHALTPIPAKTDLHEQHPDITNTPKPTRDQRSSSPDGAAAPDVAESRFDAFWQAYPKKVGKDAARKAFQKRKPTQELLESMLTALSSQASSPAWTKDGGQFIPHPATWLNQGRWQDGEEGSQVLPGWAAGAL